MAGAGFHSIAKLRAQIHWLVAVFSRRVATEEIAVPRIAIVRGPNLRAECQRPEPPAGLVLGLLRAGVGNLQNIGELIAKEIILWWQSAELESGGLQWSGIQPPPFYIESPPV
jgi:hypothetical protein